MEEVIRRGHPVRVAMDFGVPSSFFLSLELLYCLISAFVYAIKLGCRADVKRW